MVIVPSRASDFLHETDGIARPGAGRHTYSPSWLAYPARQRQVEHIYTYSKLPRENALPGSTTGVDLMAQTVSVDDERPGVGLKNHQHHRPGCTRPNSGPGLGQWQSLPIEPTAGLERNGGERHRRAGERRGEGSGRRWRSGEEQSDGVEGEGREMSGRRWTGGCE
jgi:hypothetical protein